MLNQFSRTELLLGKEAMNKLENSRVAVFGIGGVGGYVCEALARSGVYSFDLVDDDKVCLTNLNRQIIATRKTVGQYKAEVMRDRILEINPKADVRIHKCFYLPENAADFDFSEYDYVVDAVDTVTAKIELIMRAKESGTPIISSMGAGNKLDALYVVHVRQAEVFRRGDVAQEVCAVGSGDRAADGGGDVVIARCDVGDQRAEDIERRAVA